MPERRLVIVGTGQAAYQLVASLRDVGFAGKVILIGEEHWLPYQRPPLSKGFLAGTAEAGSVILQNLEYFRQRGVELKLGVRVLKIDRASKTLHLDQGFAIPYDDLVLAVGARNRSFVVPGSDAAGHFNMRTLDDATGLRSRLDNVRSAAVIGAGFLGLEFASVARAKDIEVRVFESASRVMARAISETVSEAFRTHHEERGVSFIFDTAIARIHEEGGEVSAVSSADGQCHAVDLVVSAIGVIPNTELANACGLDVNNGIVVDQHLRSSDPSVSAIGDCANFPSRFALGRCRLESVQNVIDQSRYLAGRLMGATAPYEAVPWFWSDQGGLKLQIAGLSMGADHVVLRGDVRERKFSAFRFRGQQLVGVETVNRPADHLSARKFLAAEITVTPEEIAGVTELKSLLVRSPAQVS